MQQHFWGEIFFPGGTQPSWKNTEIPGVGGVWQAPPGMKIPGGWGSSTKVPSMGGGGGWVWIFFGTTHLLTTTPCLKRDETCWCIEASISKRSHMFDCECVLLPNASLWSIGKRFGWVQLCLITEYNWSQSSNWSSIGFDWLHPEMYSSYCMHL